MDTIRFREAQSSDAAAIGAVHVASWRETYIGLLPAQLLNDLSAEARSTMWSTIINDPASSGGTVVFVATIADEIVGFGACGGQRDDALKERGFDSEVGAIYVLRSHQHAGFGSTLMNLMARKLLDQGRKATTLWVLRENAPARRFYERLGGALVGEKADEQWGEKLSEVAYGWSDLSKLARERSRHVES